MIPHGKHGTKQIPVQHLGSWVVQEGKGYLVVSRMVNAVHGVLGALWGPGVSRRVKGYLGGPGGSRGCPGGTLGNPGGPRMGPEKGVQP